MAHRYCKYIDTKALRSSWTSLSLKHTGSTDQFGRRMFLIIGYCHAKRLSLKACHARKLNQAIQLFG